MSTATLSADQSIAAWDAGYEWASANLDKARALIEGKALDAVFLAVSDDRGWTYDEDSDPYFWDRYREVTNAAKAALPYAPAPGYPDDQDNG